MLLAAQVRGGVELRGDSAALHFDIDPGGRRRVGEVVIRGAVLVRARGR